MSTRLGLVLAALAAVMSGRAGAEESAGEAYARAITKETAERDPQGAMDIYKSILERWRSEEEIAAKAQYRIGECFEKTGDLPAARAAYEAVLRDFPAQAGVVDKARERLTAVGDQAQAPTTPEEMLDKKLETTLIDLDFTDSTLSEIVDFISDFGRVSCIIDPAVGDQAANRTTFQVRKLSLRNVTKLLADSLNVEVVNRHGILVWTTPERAVELKARTVLDLPVSAPQADLAVLAKLKAIKISLNFTETPFREVASFVAEVSGLNILTVADCPDPSLTFRLEEASMVDALDLMGFLGGLKFEIEQGTVVVSSEK